MNVLINYAQIYFYIYWINWNWGKGTFWGSFSSIQGWILCMNFMLNLTVAVQHLKLRHLYNHSAVFVLSRCRVSSYSCQFLQTIEYNNIEDNGRWSFASIMRILQEGIRINLQSNLILSLHSFFAHHHNT